MALNQAMPEWRAFTSDASRAGGSVGPGLDSGAGTAAGPPGQTDRPRASLAVAGLTVLGGLLLGAALVALMTALLVPPAADDALGLDLGEPLGPATGAGVDPAAAAVAAGSVPAGRELVVDVAGAVTRPGLHRLRAGDRVGDAIAAAGGYGPRADLAAASRTLNLAQPLEDGTKVLVPELGVDHLGASGALDAGRIDLNRAGQSQLETLPGVGPVTARKIVDARAQRRFGDVRELRTRGVVGQAVFDDIKGLVTVAG